MNAAAVRTTLVKIFVPYHVDAWLATFPPTHLFPPTFTDQFVEWLNRLPPIPCHPDE